MLATRITQKEGVFYSPSPNTSQLAARMKARRTLRSLGEGGWKGFGEFRKDTSELCSEELHSVAFKAADLLDHVSFSRYYFEGERIEADEPGDDNDEHR